MRTKIALSVTWLVVALAAANVVAGCVSETDPGSSLNPQPLPPVHEPTPPGRGTEADQAPPEQAGAFNTGASSSSGSSGSSGTPAADGGADDASDTNSN